MSVSGRTLTTGAAVGAGLVTLARDTGWSTAFFVREAATLWVLAAAARFFWECFVYPHYVSPLRKLPTAPGPHWLLGHGIKLFRETPGAPMREWASKLSHEGIVRFFWLFNSERLMVTSPKALAEVLVTNNYAFQKPGNVTWTLSRVVGYGILLAEGEEHKRQRRNLNPAFSFRHVKNLYPLFWAKSREVVRAMAAACSDRGEAGSWMELEVGAWASRATLDIIGVAGLGRDFRAIEDKDNELVRTYDVIFKPTKMGRLLGMLSTVIPPWLITLLPLRRNKELAAATAKIRNVCGGLVAEKKRRMAEGKQRDVDILSVALESGLFTDSQLVDQMMTFLAAGHETTSRALTWAIYMLCCHPEVQTRLREEIRDRLPSATSLLKDGDESGASIASADIDRMPYLNAVCNEVLRCYSPVPLTAREAVHDTTILGHRVRRGTKVMLVPWAVNVNPGLWGPDAAEFKPERWQSPSTNGASEGKDQGGEGGSLGGAASNYAFLTFLHGPRSCIGSNFARSEMACLLAAWIGSFEFELVDKSMMDERNLEIKMEVTAKPARGLNVRARIIE